MIPFYLQDKLSKFNIHNPAHLEERGYIRVFQWLKHLYPSSGYNILFDLYSIANNLSIASIDDDTKDNLIKKYKSALPSYPALPQSVTEYFLNLALEEARVALEQNEIPVGAIIVKDDIVIARGHNQTIQTGKITQHAEIVALESAAQKLGTHRLSGCDLYVTLEPCAMCAGAIIHSRIRRIVFGSLSPDNGAIVSQHQLLDNPATNHHTEAICSPNFFCTSLIQHSFPE